MATAAAETAAADLADRLLAGQPAAIARAISWIENGDPRADDLLDRLPQRQAHVIGITGSPGAGKSTLVSLLIGMLRAGGRTIGVLAVDPSSPVTGGALLGDRVRLEGTAGDRGVFFRSLASRGAAGGLSAATRAASIVLSAGGFGTVLIETVGAGQAEVSVMKVADTVALVLHPGAGDEIQAEKAGLMEIADVYVINKADRPGATALKAQIDGVLQLAPDEEWSRPIVETVATESRGGEELLAALEAHRAHLAEGTGEVRTRSAAREEVLRSARSAFEEALAEAGRQVLPKLDAGHVNERRAKEELIRRAVDLMLGDEGPEHRVD